MRPRPSWLAYYIYSLIVLRVSHESLNCGITLLKKKILCIRWHYHWLGFRFMCVTGRGPPARSDVAERGGRDGCPPARGVLVVLCEPETAWASVMSGLAGLEARRQALNTQKGFLFSQD